MSERGDSSELESPESPHPQANEESDEEPQPPPRRVFYEKPRHHVPRPINLAGKYLLTELHPGSLIYKCFCVDTHQIFYCRLVRDNGINLQAALQRMTSNPRVNNVYDLIPTSDHKVYMVYSEPTGDLYTHLGFYKVIGEPRARLLFRQMAEVVKDCHDKGVILRDVRLNKFAFADPDKTLIMLESLEDAVVIDDLEDDMLMDRRSCPHYVSPEVLQAHVAYSGRCADMWSLGIVLFAMLAGKHPFRDPDQRRLYQKIRRGQFVFPGHVSTQARCLIQGMLQLDPNDRMTAEEVLRHPWLEIEKRCVPNQGNQDNQGDQVVPF